MALASRGDPLIDEVRTIRQAISKSFGNEVDWLCDHLQELESEHAHRRVGAELSETLEANG